MEKKNEFALEVVSVRLVRDSPILSDKNINNSADVFYLVGKVL